MNAAQITALAGWALAGGALSWALRPAITRLTTTSGPIMAPLGVLEAITAALFAALAYRFGSSMDLLPYSALASACVPLATLDLTTRRLPNAALAMTSSALIILFGLIASLNAELGQLARAVACMLAALATHGVLYALGGIGGGDLKLAGVLGLALGWLSWQSVFLGLALGWLLGGLFVAFVKISRRCKVAHDVPLGPFLISGTIIVILSGS